jgi:hypothetical protein
VDKQSDCSTSSFHFQDLRFLKRAVVASCASMVRTLIVQKGCFYNCLAKFPPSELVTRVTCTLCFPTFHKPESIKRRKNAGNSFTFGTHTLKGNTLQYFTWCFNLEKTEWDKLIDNLIKQGILGSPKVIKAMRTVPRTRFLPPDMQSYYAADTPLPIGFGQTISAPHGLNFALG